jgi:hypothetical protein
MATKKRYIFEKSDLGLYKDMLKYEDMYFKDMTLNLKKIYMKLFSSKSKSGQIVFHDDLFISLGNNWTIKYVKRPKKFYGGRCSPNKKTIYINRNLTKEETKIVVLHEMIHAYEFLLLEQKQYQDYVFLYLYEMLSKKFGKKKLLRIISVDVHRLITVGQHSIMFLFKSLDLDLRFKRPLGTVHSYGREELFR